MTTTTLAGPKARTTFRTDTSTALMERVRRDQPGAFGDLVREFGPRILARYIRVFHDRQMAEDLTQDVFLRVYRARKRYRPRARFTTWLFHITQNVARNALRGLRRRNRLQLGLEEEGLPAAYLAAPEPTEDPLERKELARMVRSAISGLGRRQRTALEMQQFQNRSYAEIAAALDLTPKATKSLLYRARLQLKEILAESL